MCKLLLSDNAIFFLVKMNDINISKTCANCLRETKVFLLDLNSFDPKGRKIRFKRCKRKMPLEKKKDFCVTLILDKIVIKI